MEKEDSRLNCAWLATCAYLKPTVVNEYEKFEVQTWTHENFENFYPSALLLMNEGMIPILEEWFFRSFKVDMEKIAKKFWIRITTQPENENAFHCIPAALSYLSSMLLPYYKSAMQLQSFYLDQGLTSTEFSGDSSCSLKQRMLNIVKSFLSFCWPQSYRILLLDYLADEFHKHECKDAEIREKQIADIVLCEIETLPQEIKEFDAVLKYLYAFEISDALMENIPIYVAQRAVDEYTWEYFKGNFSVRGMGILSMWMERTIFSWLDFVYCKNIGTGNHDRLKECLMHHMNNALGNVYINQLFDIIIEYPDSEPVLQDLRALVAFSNLRPKLIKCLISSLKSRLLQSGVDTADILTAYISAIKSLRIVDRTGVVLQAVSEPVCKYLRSREDTVRCIISSLREDSCSELACELLKAVPPKSEHEESEQEIEENWEKWTPDPLDADPTKSSESHRSSDIFGILVNIYGSKELFMNEYRSLLADKILSKFEYDTEKELRYLELLKLRFGESQLHLCEVMLKDIADSKRLQAHINSGELKTYEVGDFPINPMILSAQFWPAFKEEKLRLPEFMWDNLAKFTKTFESLKGNRTLTWKPHLGLINMDIDLKNGETKNLSVTPMQATILWHFQKKECWSISELSNITQVPVSVLRRRITFWQSHGILSEVEPNIFKVMDDTKGNQDVVMIEEEAESVTASSQDMKEEELQTFWSFIIGMLTNMESLPLERIHSMLRMFAVQGTSTNECSIEDMKKFLEKKVRDRQLVYSGGMFKLPKFET